MERPSAWLCDRPPCSCGEHYQLWGDGAVRATQGSFNLRNLSWRAGPTRWRLAAPPGFIGPCEPTFIDRPPAGPDWLHEVIIARKKLVGQRVTLENQI
jgi:hypothetical protein